MFSVGQVIGIKGDTLEIQIGSGQLGVVSPVLNSPLIFGSDTVGIQYYPKVGDHLLLESEDNHHIYIVGTYIPPDKLQQNLKTINLKLLPLQQDEIIMFNSSGASIKLDASGNIHLTPGGTGWVKIHNLQTDNFKQDLSGV